MKKSLPIILLLALALLTIFLRLHIIDEPIPQDVSVYAHLGHEMLEGKALYAEIWDHKPPGVALVFMAAEAVAGYGETELLLINIFFSLMNLLFCYLFLVRISSRGTALIGALFLTLSSTTLLLEVNQPNVEPFMNAFTLAALWAYASSKQGSAPWLLLAGLLFAVASLFKMIVVFPLAALCLYVLIAAWQDRKETGGQGRSWLFLAIKNIVLLSIPITLVWIVTFALFAAFGTFSEFYEAVFTFNQSYSSKSGGIVHNTIFFFTNAKAFFHSGLAEVWPLALLSFLWIFTSRRDYNGVGRWFFLLIIFGVLVEIASPGKYFQHYYQLLLPFFAVLAALFIHDLADFSDKLGAGRTLALRVIFTLFAIAYVGYFQLVFLSMTPDEISRAKHGERAIKAKEIGLYLREVSSECDTIFNWGDETGMHFYSRRSSAASIFYLYPLRNDTPEGRAKKLALIKKELTTSPPAFIVWENDYQPPELSVLSTLIRERYHLAGHHAWFTLFELNGHKSGKKADCAKDAL